MVFTVNSAGDDPAGPTPSVETLRDAITAVNSDAADSSSSPDVINFAIAGTPTIILNANLPAINNPVTIDGSMQAGVTVNGNTFAMLVDDSAATINAVTFTGGTVSVGASDTLTVGTGSTVSATGDLNAGASAILNNDGSVSVAGNFVGSDSTGVYNAPFSTSTTTFTASFTVGGAYTAGADGFLYNNGTATFSVTKGFTLGDDGFVYNGLTSTDAAMLTVGGSLNVGADGGWWIYNYGTSAIEVTGDFTLDGFLYNGVSSTDAATLTVSKSLSTTDFVYNDGTSTLEVTGDFTVGSDAFLYNGVSSTDAATLTVGGSFSIGDSSAGMFDSGSAYNYGTSTFTVGGNFTIYGDGGSSVYSGTSNADSPTLAVGGSFSLGANSAVYTYGTKPFSVSGRFTLGDNSYFNDSGTMSLAGAFNPGAGNPMNIDTVGGTFTAASGSTVTTDTATWQVLAGGQLNVAAGGTFDVASGGTLLDDSSGSVTDQGSLTVEGTLLSAVLSTVVVDENGQLSTHGAGQLNIQGTLLTWNDPADIPSGTALGAAQLGATASSGGSPLSGTFTYSLADDTTPADAAVLKVGNDQTLNVTFTPDDTADYSSASAQVGINVVTSGQVTPTVAVNTVNLTYGTALANSQLSGTATATVNGQTVPVVGTFTYTSAAGTVPGAGNGQTEAVTFTPNDTTDYTTASAIVTVNVGRATPRVSAPAQSTTYTDLQQGYPTSAVTVTGANGLTSSGGTLSFTYNGSSNVPTHAGSYSVVVTFTPNDTTDYTSASTTTTWSINQAVPVITWNTPGAIAHFTPLGSNQLNAVANVPGTFVYSPPAGTLLPAGTQTLSAKFTPADSTDYKTTTATVPIVVLGPGVTAIGTQLYFVGGNTSTDQVQVNPAGNSNTGSTGVKVQSSLNGVNTQTVYSQSFTTINIFLQNGNENIQMANSLTINAVVTAGNGNDNIQLANGNNTVTLGNGNDTVQAGNGSTTLVAGGGKDNVRLGNGSYDNLTLGSGNDNVQIGNGSYEVVVLGNGNDNVQLGDGSYDNVALGTGNDNVQIGNGSNNTVTLPGTGNGHVNVTFGNGRNNTIKLGNGGGGVA